MCLFHILISMTSINITLYPTSSVHAYPTIHVTTNIMCVPSFSTNRFASIWPSHAPHPSPTKYVSLFADLSYNRLAKISEKAFENLSNLTYLDVSYNKLSRIEPECLEPVAANLRTFNISGNLQLDLMEVNPTFQVMYAEYILLTTECTVGFSSVQNVTSFVRISVFWNWTWLHFPVCYNKVTSSLNTEFIHLCSFSLPAYRSSRTYRPWP